MIKAFPFTVFAVVITPVVTGIPKTVPLLLVVKPLIKSVVIFALVRIAPVIVGEVRVLLVSVWLSVVPTITPAGASFDHVLVPAPVPISKLLAVGVEAVMPSLF